MGFKTVAVAPPNSVVLVMDPRTGDVPETMGGQLVASTPSCVAIGCLAEKDGQTSLHLGDYEVTPAHALIFDGLIETPSRLLAVCNVRREPYLSMAVAEERTQVRIWVNDDVEPDDIGVVVPR